MKIRSPRSIIIISFYIAINAFIIWSAVQMEMEEDASIAKPAALAPEYTEIIELDYFFLKAGVPQLSVTADKMRSQGEELAEFEKPRGLYNYLQKQKTIRYQALEGVYKKQKDLLTLDGNVKIESDEAEYLGTKIKYYFKKDLVVGSGGVTFIGTDLKSKDSLKIVADTMRAHPQSQDSLFTGNVKGDFQRKKKYEGKMSFSSHQLKMEGLTSLAHLEGDVRMTRSSYLITAGKADIHLENYNKSLKYFVMNDDVKMTETLKTPEGITQRKAYAERLEGFGREEKMILSGAPKVEQGKDVLKGYRITIRENVDLIEVEDAVTDVQMKREKKKKLKE